MGGLGRPIVIGAVCVPVAALAAASMSAKPKVLADGYLTMLLLPGTHFETGGVIGGP